MRVSQGQSFKKMKNCAEIVAAVRPTQSVRFLAVAVPKPNLPTGCGTHKVRAEQAEPLFPWPVAGRKEKIRFFNRFAEFRIFLSNHKKNTGPGACEFWLRPVQFPLAICIAKPLRSSPCTGKIGRKQPNHPASLLADAN
jgi:hypothetical protein